MQRLFAAVAPLILLASVCHPAFAEGNSSDWGGNDAEWGSLPSQCKCDDLYPRNSIPLYPTMFGDLGGFGGFQGGGFGGGGGQFGGGGGAFGGGGGQFGGGGFGGGGGQFGGGGGFQGGGFGAPISVFRGSYKISENESPLPQNRVYIGYNYYNNVNRIADVHRETIGIEKTFLDGSASVGVRLPAIQVNSDVGFNDYGNFADLTIPLKFALWTDPRTGSVLSAGIAVTAPTGPNPTGITLNNGQLVGVHPTLLQPFVGYFVKRDSFFLQGFHSVMTPTDSRDLTAIFNDVAVGCWLDTGGGLVKAVVPTLEAHINTPTNFRNANDFPRYRDSVNLTSGMTWIFAKRTTLSGAVVSPVTGPKLFDFETITNLNIFF